MERIKYNPYLTETVFNIELKQNEVQLFKIPVAGEENRKNVIFTNSPFSILFLKTNDNSGLKKYFSNINLYYYFQNDNEIKHEKTLELYFIVYNPNNIKRNINLEYKNEKDRIMFKSVNFDYFNNNPYLYYDSIGLSYIFDDEPGLFEINNKLENYLFIDNIEDIKNLTDLLSREHYQYIPNGKIYSPNNYFILLNINPKGNINLKVSKIPLEEKETELSDLYYSYFKIPQNKNLTFSYTFKTFQFKLLSKNNGTVKINNDLTFFNQNDIKNIYISRESLTITAIDNNFTFGIKIYLKPSFPIGQFEKDYFAPNYTNYTFVPYPVYQYYNASIIKIELQSIKEIIYNYELALNLDEIQKKV